jgi:hypothetical protein
MGLNNAAAGGFLQNCPYRAGKKLPTSSARCVIKKRPHKRPS